MNTELTRFDLGDRGLEYLRQELISDGTLGSAIARHVDLSVGQVFTEFPSSVIAAQLLDFCAGGKLPLPPVETHVRGPDGSRLAPIPSMNEMAVRRIERFLENVPHSVCVLNNSMARWGEPHTRSLLRRTWLVRSGDEVLHLVTPGTSDHSQVESTFRLAFQFVSFIGVLSALGSSEAELPKRGTRLDDGLLSRIAMNAQVVFVGAYDGEGLVYWQRTAR